MANTYVEVPLLGKKFVDYRQPIWGDSFNWSWNRPLEQVKYLVIHHSVTKHDATPDDIALLHKARGWAGIGYHFVITKDGTAYYVGDIGTARANVKDKNELILGICLVGDFTRHLPSDEQITSAHLLCNRLIELAPNVKSWEDVTGHKDHQATACPGSSWDVGGDSMYERIKNNVPYTPPEPVLDNYQLIYKGDALEEFEKNPRDSINTLNDDLATKKDLLAAEITKNADLGIENTELTEEITKLKSRNTEIGRERDDAIRESKTLSTTLETQTIKVAELQAKLDADDPIVEYSRWELLRTIFSRRSRG